MKITSIWAEANVIRLVLDTPPQPTDDVSILVFSPLCCDELSPLCAIEAQQEDNTLTIPRFATQRDGVSLCYGLMVNEEIIQGKQYVEEITTTQRTYPYPVTDSKKGLQISDPEDAKILGVRHSAINVNQGDFMMPAPEEGNTINFEYDGQTYYFRKSHVESMDAIFREMHQIGVIVSLILLNSPRWRCDIDPAFWEVIKHPAYTGKKEDGTGLISAFNLCTQAGVDHYCAFVAFLAQRYTREDAMYGRCVGMIIGNEVDSGYIWCNAGEMCMEDYMREYTAAMRLAWQVSTTYYQHMRIYFSLDHFWTASVDSKLPNKYYKPRDMLLYACQLCQEEGQFPWNIAHHPYPQDLHFPDFWNDTESTDDDDTILVTFQNLEVLARFIHRPEMLYKGEPRRIILSEQGFNSHWTPESEILQAVAYGRAYRKVMEIPEIDSFILHAHLDNMYEFGLSLGLWRRKPDSNELDAPKPIYYVFKAIDKKDEKGVYHWQRY